MARDPLSVRSPSVILGTLTTVLVAGFPAGSFAANCYLVAPAPGEECVIIDPGQDAAPGIDELAREHRLKPVAVLLTHGHIDHVWSVAPVCGARGVPAYIHPDDRELLSDPARGFALGAAQQLFGGLTLSEPDDVRELADATTLHIAGLEITVDHAPGHTPGSVTFRLPGEPAADGGQSATGGPATGGPATGGPATGGPATGGPATGGPATAGGAAAGGGLRPGILFSGDLLFAGSIGRTDLPGGDYQTIMDSLVRVCLPLPGATVVLPGHGPQTTIDTERATNPFLVPLARPAAEGSQAAPENTRARRL
jgi:hydroxyacylglutathione hydrolase